MEDETKIDDTYVEVKVLGTVRDLEEIIRLFSVVNRLNFDGIDKTIRVNIQGSKKSVFAMINGNITQTKKEYIDRIEKESITLGT
jgi:trimethylamine:corrinoid methyltransferase-like protein